MKRNKDFYTQAIRKYWLQWQAIAPKYRDQEAIKQQLAEEKGKLIQLLEEVEQQENQLRKARTSVSSLWGRLTGRKSVAWKTAEEALRKAKNTHYVKMILVEELEEKLQDEIDPTPIKTAYTNAIETKFIYLKAQEPNTYEQVIPYKQIADLVAGVLKNIRKLLSEQSPPLFEFLTNYQRMMANTHATQGASAEIMETVERSFGAQQENAKVIQKINREVNDLFKVYTDNLIQIEFYSQYIFQVPQWPNSIQKELSIDQQQSKTWLSWQQYMGFANMTGNWLSTDKLQHILQEINDLKGCLQKTNELLHHYQQTLELYAYPFVEEDFQQVITKA